MSDPRKIEIELAAKGGDEATAEIRKVGEVIEDIGRETPKAAEAVEKQAEAIRDLTEAEKDYQARKEAFESRRASGGFDKGSSVAESTRGFGGMLDTSPERAEQAAAATEKVTDAVNEQAEAIQDLGNKSEEARPKVERLDENVGNISRAQKAQAVAQLAGEIGKLGGKFREVADEVEVVDADLAEKLRNTAGNIESVSGAVDKLAFGFAAGGPYGAAAAGLAVAVETVINSYVEAAAKALEFQERSETAFDSVIDRMAAANAEKSRLELKTWLQTISEEEAAVNKQNEALDRNVGLMRAKAEAEEKRETATAKKRIAEIDADPNLTEADKIRQKAQIEEQLQKRAVEAQINAQGRDVASSEQDAARKQEEASKLSEKAAELARRAAADEEERKDLERREKQREMARNALPKAISEEASADWKEYLLQGLPGSQKRFEDLQQKRKNIEELGNQAAERPEEAVRLKQLNETKREVEASAAKAAEEARQAAEQADKARLDAEAKRNVLEETAPIIVDTYREESIARATRTAAQVRAAEKRAEDRNKRQDDAANDAGYRRKIDDAEDNLDETARAYSAKMRGGSGGGLVAQIGRMLQDGTNGGEIERVGRMITEKLGSIEKRQSDALLLMYEELEAQQKRIEHLTGSFRKSRDMR